MISKYVLPFSRVPFNLVDCLFWCSEAFQVWYAVLCLVAQLCPTLCDPMDYSPQGSSVHGDSPDKYIGVGYHALLQGLFPTQGSNPGLPHCRQIIYQLSHQRSPRILEWVAYPVSRGSSQTRNRTAASCIAVDSLPAELPGKPLV